MAVHGDALMLHDSSAGHKTRMSDGMTIAVVSTGIGGLAAAFDAVNARAAGV